MKIGRKIALFYTLVTVLTTMAVIGVFYLFRLLPRICFNCNRTCCKGINILVE